MRNQLGLQAHTRINQETNLVETEGLNAEAETANDTTAIERNNILFILSSGTS